MSQDNRIPDDLSKPLDERVGEIEECRKRLARIAREKDQPGGVDDAVVEDTKPGSVDKQEKKAAERGDLRESSRQMLQLVMDNIPQAIFWKDTNSVYLGCNIVLARDVGLNDPSECVGKTEFDLPTTREQTESYRKYDQLVMANDRPIYHIIEEQQRPDGTTAWLDTNKIPIHDPEGRVIGILCTYEDITERKKAEMALEESERKFQILAHNISEVLFLVSPDWKHFSFVSPAYEEVWSRQVKSLYQDPLSWTYPVITEDKMQVLNFIEKQVRGEIGEADSLEYRILRPDGTIRWIVARTYPVHDEQGNVYLISGVAVDITERKEAEKVLQGTKAQVELYLDLMGHDINNLNQIGIGFLELALETLDLDSQGKELLARPLEALESSTRLIENVRKLQKIREGGLKLYQVNLRDIVQYVVSRYSTVPGRSISITYRAEGECMAIANDLLGDVFGNIVGNSIKHSRSDLSISIRSSHTMLGEKSYCVTVIEDDGPGIPDFMKDRLFTSFKSEKDKDSGRGLGLYIVKTLIDSYNGRIWAEDRVEGDPPQGARFVVMLPSANH